MRVRAHVSTPGTENWFLSQVSKGHPAGRWTAERRDGGCCPGCPQVALIGANGCGKSTVLRCISGSRETDGGHVAVAYNAAVGYLEQTAVNGSTRTVHEARACALLLRSRL